MRLSHNTILITGGTSGIGLEFAIQFLKLDNTVVITGRYPQIHVFQSDVREPQSIAMLFHAVIDKFPGMNILTNNAGIMRHIDRRHAAVLNVSSGLAFVPLPASPVYCAAKAGVHSFTQSLRVQLQDTSVKVFELAPPPTRTPLLAGVIHGRNTPGVPPIDVASLVGQAIARLKQNRMEIRPGLSNLLKLMSRIAPQFFLNRLTKGTGAALPPALPQ